MSRFFVYRERNIQGHQLREYWVGDGTWSTDIDDRETMGAKMAAATRDSLPVDNVHVGREP